MTLRRVVVTGMGALTPIGNDLNSYWNGLISGSSGCADITHFDASEFKTKFACELKGFDPADHFEKKEFRRYVSLNLLNSNKKFGNYFPRRFPWVDP